MNIISFYHVKTGSTTILQLGWMLNICVDATTYHVHRCQAIVPWIHVIDGDVLREDRRRRRGETRKESGGKHCVVINV